MGCVSSVSQTDDGKLQVTAAASLLETSKLVHWELKTSQFIPVSEADFECALRWDPDPVFARLRCWMMFSAGAEFLAKGVCLVNQIEIREHLQVPAYPTPSNIGTWPSKFLADWKTAGRPLQSTSYGTMGNLCYDSKKKNTTAFLKQLCSTVDAMQSDQERLLAAYGLLALTIRNRDAHAYRPKERQSHFWLVPDLFCGCLNLLLQWLPGGAATLTTWKNDAASFIATL